jgi:hypothetical protein
VKPPQRIKNNNKENRLWDFLPDPFGSGSCFIQNPHTGYVIEIADGSSASGASLVVNPRRLFGNNHQLWSAVDEQFSEEAFRSLSLAPAPSRFGSNNQYVLLAPNQRTNLKSVVVTIDIIEDLIAESFSRQINGNVPYPTDAQLDADWMQYVLLMQDNSLLLLTQVWHALGPDKWGDPLASVPATSASMLQPQNNNAVAAGTRIVLTPTIDHSNDDFVTGVSGQVFDKGMPIGTPRTLSVIGQQTFNPGGPVKEKDLAPFGALSVVVVDPPSGTTNFSSGWAPLR